MLRWLHLTTALMFGFAQSAAALPRPGVPARLVKEVSRTVDVSVAAPPDHLSREQLHSAVGELLDSLPAGSETGAKTSYETWRHPDGRFFERVTSADQGIRTTRRIEPPQQISVRREGTGRTSMQVLSHPVLGHVEVYTSTHEQVTTTHAAKALRASFRAKHDHLRANPQDEDDEPAIRRDPKRVVWGSRAETERLEVHVPSVPEGVDPHDALTALVRTWALGTSNPYALRTREWSDTTASGVSRVHVIHPNSEVEDRTDFHVPLGIEVRSARDTWEGPDAPFEHATLGTVQSVGVSERTSETGVRDAVSKPARWLQRALAWLMGKAEPAPPPPKANALEIQAANDNEKTSVER